MFEYGAEVPGVQAIDFQVSLDLVRLDPGYPYDVGSFPRLHGFLGEELRDTVALLGSLEALPQLCWDGDGSVPEVVGLGQLISPDPFLRLLHHCRNLSVDGCPSIDHSTNRQEALPVDHRADLTILPYQLDLLPKLSELSLDFYLEAQILLGELHIFIFLGILAPVHFLKFFFEVLNIIKT